MRRTVSQVRHETPQRVAEHVGHRIAELRRKRGDTQAQLAERLEVSLKYLQRLERGVNMTIASLVSIANHLEVSVRDLFTTPHTRPTPRRPGRPPGSGKKTAPPRR